MDKVDADYKRILNEAFDRYDEQNFNEAIELFKLVQNSSNTLYSNIANIYAGVSYLELGNIDKGLNLIYTLANNKDILAIETLGKIYGFGQYGLSKDIKKAINYNTQGCKLGSKDSCINLFLLLKDTKYDRIDYIKKNISLLKFIKVATDGKITKFIPCIFKLFWHLFKGNKNKI